MLSQRRGAHLLTLQELVFDSLFRASMKENGMVHVTCHVYRLPGTSDSSQSDLGLPLSSQGSFDCSSFLCAMLWQQPEGSVSPLCSCEPGPCGSFLNVLPGLSAKVCMPQSERQRGVDQPLAGMSESTTMWHLELRAVFIALHGTSVAKYHMRWKMATM
ncbi:hypothetical protein DPEC_G00204940 [Dallia pectoralis]|uniref:Uncharacterized protein n=1 Tax=Dallia pectoralis TaxID=75939 RepID=A0ACC2G3X7_DALPE|nr:hypothetical protein DPEC_G00204940 [Dallia pectoralis]